MKLAFAARGFTGVAVPAGAAAAGGGIIWGGPWRRRCGGNPPPVFLSEAADEDLGMALGTAPDGEGLALKM